FLYQLDRYMEYFGHAPDSRVRELIAGREVARDLNPIFADTPVWEGDLRLPYVVNVSGLKLPQKVGGNVQLLEVIDGAGLEMPKEVTGHLWMSGLERARGLKLPEIVGGDVDLGSLTSMFGVMPGSHIGGDLAIGSVKKYHRIVGSKPFGYVGGDVDLSRLVAARGRALLRRVGGDVHKNPRLRGRVPGRYIVGKILDTPEYGLYN
ncbi:MAG: hypothetical protein ACREHG_01330, partial [Candidatus Saccharimonadales bacterium]